MDKGRQQLLGSVATLQNNEKVQVKKKKHLSQLFFSHSLINLSVLELGDFVSNRRDLINLRSEVGFLSL